MPRPSRRLVSWFTRLLAGALFACGVSAAAYAQSGAVLRVGFQKGGLLSIVKAQGQLETRVKPLGYSVQWFEFPAGPQMLEALNAGSVDLAYTGAPPPVFAQAGGVPFVYVGTEPAALHGEALLVPANSAIKTPADLRGKKIALQKGSSANYLLLRVLEKAGIPYIEIHPVYFAPADARAAFESGGVDAWAIWDPYNAAAQQALKARTLADYTGLIGAYGFYEARREFADQHPDLVRTALAQFRATGLWVDAHQNDAAALLAPRIGLPQPVVETWLGRTHFGAAPVTEAVVSSQQGVADAFYAIKLIPNRLTVSDNVWADKDTRWAQ